jgi:hypothetical protein
LSDAELLNLANLDLDGPDPGLMNVKRVHNLMKELEKAEEEMVKFQEDPVQSEINIDPLKPAAYNKMFRLGEINLDSISKDDGSEEERKSRQNNDQR